MSVQDLAGQTLGQYELRELLGVGGMGAVYRAYQTNLKREVAVKILTAQLAQSAGYIERFNREAETAASLEHYHIIPIYDYGTQRGTSYVVMRLLTGGTLADRISQHQADQKPLPSLVEIAGLLRQLGSALDYAHSRGVIHRDIKPSNVMFDNQGSAYLVDFGIAKLVEATHALTGSGVALGTPTYMPPEQWRAEELTPAADQYALAVMTYALITGRPPFEASTPYGLMHKHLNELPTPPQTLRTGVPADVAQVLERALSKRPQDRFPSVTAFAQAFEKAASSSPGQPTHFFTTPVRPRPIPSRPVTPSNPSGGLMVPAATRPASKNPLFWAMGAVIVVLLATVLVLLLSQDGKQDTPATPTAAGIAAAATQTLASPSLGDDVVPTRPVIEIKPSETPEVSSTPTPTLTPTETPTPPATATPTSSPIPTLSATDLAATLQAEMALVMTDDAQTAAAQAVLDLTLTATQWTATPAPDLRATARALLTVTQQAIWAGQTATAESWTDTPTATPTNSLTPSRTPTATFTLTHTPTFTLTPTPTPNAVSGWPMEGYSAARTGHNVAEHRLQPPLRQLWVANLGDYYADKLTATEGRVAVAGMNADQANQLVMLDATTGDRVWDFVLTGGGGGAMDMPGTFGAGNVYFSGQGDKKLYAVDAQTGRLVWENTGFNGFYASQMAVVEDRLFVPGANDGAAAYEASTGDLLWGRTGGAWGLPLAVAESDRLVLSVTGSTLFVQDMNLGTVRWKYAPITTGWSWITLEDANAYVMTGETEVTAFDLSSGESRWRRNLDLVQPSSYGPAMADGRLFVPAWQLSSGSGGVVALDTATGQELWRFETGSEGVMGLGVANDVLYVVGWSAATVYALEPESGQTLWSFYLAGAGGPLAIADGVLYVAAWSNIYAFGN